MWIYFNFPFFFSLNFSFVFKMTMCEVKLSRFRVADETMFRQWYRFVNHTKKGKKIVHKIQWHFCFEKRGQKTELKVIAEGRAAEIRQKKLKTRKTRDTKSSRNKWLFWEILFPMSCVRRLQWNEHKVMMKAFSEINGHQPWKGGISPHLPLMYVKKWSNLKWIWDRICYAAQRESPED